MPVQEQIILPSIQGYLIFKYYWKCRKYVHIFLNALARKNLRLLLT